MDQGALINSQDKVCLNYLYKVFNHKKYGNTAMHIAILNNDLEMCQILQAFHPNLTLKNQVEKLFQETLFFKKDKLSAIDLIFSENDKQIFDFFRSKDEYANLFKIEN